MSAWRWKYFTPEEVLSPKGLDDFARNNLRVQGHAMDKLESMRHRLGLPLRCNHSGLKYRGWRSYKENKKIGGVEDSPHTAGVAFDLSCYKITMAEFAVWCLQDTYQQHLAAEPNTAQHGGVRALGIYPSQNFFHCDYRSFPHDRENYIVAWNGDNQRTAVLDKRALSSNSQAVLLVLKSLLGVPQNWVI